MTAPRPRRPRGPLSSRLLAVFSGLVLAFLVVPILLVIPMSFTSQDYLEFPPTGLSLRWYAAFFTDPDWIDPTLFSLEVAALTAVVSVILGAAASLALVRSRFSASPLVSAIVAAPMTTPAIIVAVGIYLVLSRVHLTGTLLGFVLAHSVLALPLVVFSVSAGLQRIDQRLEQVAVSLGASRWAAICSVTLPIIRPSLLVAAAFAFVTSFDEATVAFFISTADAKTLPKKMFEDIQWQLSPTIAAVSTLLTLGSLVLVLLAALGRHACLQLSSDSRQS